MNVLVFIGTISDPKWPLPTPALAADGGAPQLANDRRILSPFDEAALEIALKLRDARPDTRLSVVVAGGSDTDGVLRGVAALRPDQLFRLDCAGAPGSDAVALARHISASCTSLLTVTDLVLIGRECGDLDNGMLAPCLAEMLGRRFLALVQDVEWTEAGAALMRERGGAEEWHALVPPQLVSITNDRRNRLRHPLMKNVMAAKRASIPELAAAPAGTGTATVATRALRPVTADAGWGNCRILSGTLEQRSGELANLLMQWKDPR